MLNLTQDWSMPTTSQTKEKKYPLIENSDQEDSY